MMKAPLEAILLTILLGPWTALPAAAQKHFPDDSELRLILRYLVEDGETPGAVLGVLDPDGSMRVVGYGTAGPDSTPMTPDAVFEIGSITKTFTATLLADMVLRGEVALDDPLARYLPDGVTVPSVGAREITLLDLATHRSGLPTVPDDFDPPGASGAAEAYTVEDAYAFLSRHELQRAPGARREYSNFGFALLGHALARAAGRDYQELIRMRILEPLGMESTGFDSGEVVGGHRKGKPVRHRSDMALFDPAGGLRSTARDLLVFMKAHVGPPETELERAMRLALDARLVAADEGAADSLAAGRPSTDMDRARRLAGDPSSPEQDDAHRLAWGTIRYPGERPVIGHAGGTPGFSTQLTFVPEEGIGTVLLTNDGEVEDRLGTHLLYFARPSAAPGGVAVDTAVLAEYAGTYRWTRAGGEVFVRLEPEGWLTYQPEGRYRDRMHALSDSTFYILRGPWAFTFVRDDEGSVTGLWAEVDEREQDQSAASRMARRVSAGTPPPAVVAGNAPGWAGWSGRTWALVVAGILVAAALVLRPLLRRRRRHRT